MVMREQQQVLYQLLQYTTDLRYVLFGGGIMIWAAWLFCEAPRGSGEWYNQTRAKHSSDIRQNLQNHDIVTEIRAA